MPKDDTVEQPLLRFGVIADPQYAPQPMTMNRYYAASLGKLDEAVRFFNKQDDLSFVITLGDVIDNGWDSFDHILSIYGRLTAPTRFVLGNHDFYVGEERLHGVPGRLGLSRGYYDFEAGGTRCIVVDGTEASLFAHHRGGANRAVAEKTLAEMRARGEINAHDWNGGISETQYAWLEDRLDAAQTAGERVILFGHLPVQPFSSHALWGHDRLTTLLDRHPNVLAYFNGHDHAGNYAEVDGRHFLNFRGMVETETDTAYALVELWPDRIEIIGRGVEPCRTLAVR